jgi:hypothetical protein
MRDPAVAPNPGTPGAPTGGNGGAGLSDADFGDNGASGKSAVEYKAELPADLKLPDGVSFKFDDKDPVHGDALAEARKLAREAGLDQTTFSRMLGLHAKLALREADVEQARVNIERQAITGFEARKSAMVAFLDRNLSAEQSRAIQAGVHDRRAFEAIEALIAKATGRAAPISSTPTSEKSWAERMWPDGFSKEGRPPAGRRQ